MQWNAQDNIHPSLGGMKKVLFGGEGIAEFFVGTWDVHRVSHREESWKEGTTPRNSGSKTSKHHIRTDWDAEMWGSKSDQRLEKKNLRSVMKATRSIKGFRLGEGLKQICLWVRSLRTSVEKRLRGRLAIGQYQCPRGRKWHTINLFFKFNQFLCPYVALRNNP